MKTINLHRFTILQSVVHSQLEQVFRFGVCFKFKHAKLHLISEDAAAATNNYFELIFIGLERSFPVAIKDMRARHIDSSDYSWRESHPTLIYVQESKIPNDSATFIAAIEVVGFRVD